MMGSASIVQAALSAWWRFAMSAGAPSHDDHRHRSSLFEKRPLLTGIGIGVATLLPAELEAKRRCVLGTRRVCAMGRQRMSGACSKR